jgi:hypothetical protein
MVAFAPFKALQQLLKSLLPSNAQREAAMDDNHVIAIATATQAVLTVLIIATALFAPWIQQWARKPLIRFLGGETRKGHGPTSVIYQNFGDGPSKAIPIEWRVENADNQDATGEVTLSSLAPGQYARFSVPHGLQERGGSIFITGVALRASGPKPNVEGRGLKPRLFGRDAIMQPYVELDPI